MRVAITGASGLIGRALTGGLVERGDTPVPARRRRDDDAKLVWSTTRGFDPPDALSGYDAVVHLAGESVGVRWTEERKARIMSSRVDGTRAVVAALEAADPRPPVFICASAIGIYASDTRDDLDEDGPHGNDFMADVCKAWEAEAHKAKALDGVRLVIARTGLVLSPTGGALAKMLPAFRMGVGGKIGDGLQPMSWVHIDDVVAALLWLIDTNDADGPYNLVAPAPTTNLDFTKSLGRALSRPTVIPVPAFGIRLLFGEMGDTVLLHGQRVVPRRLLEADFRFTHADLDAALADVIG